MFRPASTVEVKEIKTMSPSKPCDLDTLSISVLRKLVPLIAVIINRSLTELMMALCSK